MIKRQEDLWIAARDERKPLYTAFLKRAHSLCHPAAAALEDADEQIEQLGFAGYVQLLKDVNDEVLRNRLRGARIRLLRFRDDEAADALQRGPSTYFWMRDEKEAIVVIVPLGSTVEHGRSVAAREIAFSTLDPQMMHALKGIYERYEQAAPVFTA